MATLPLLIIGIVIVIGAIILVIVGIKSPQGSDPLEDRLAEFASRGETASLEEIEMSQPFSQRIVMPIAKRLGEFVMRFTPQNAINSMSKKVELAGNPGNLDPTIFFALRFVGIPFGLIFIFLARVAPPGSFLYGKGLLLGLPAAVLGFYLPDLLLQSKIDRRQKEIRKAMPDGLDLLTICVEAGLGFDAAMAKLYDKWDNELGRAFGRVVREIQLGKLRREALRDMADRLGVSEMSSFVAAVIQSEQLGVSMAQVLRIQADQMRVRRRQLAEEEAHKAPIKMLLPMAIFIFPALCIVLMTPAFLILIETGAGPLG
ncbi:MAG: type II secretion system protein [Anaerolineales bacterium]|nr:MAG: type II secretion system protein [Anaerolineales bacterium]